MNPSLSIDEAKRLLPLPALARRLNIAAELPERDGQLVRFIWPSRHKHGDKRQSFNFYDGLTRWKCFACGASGDGMDLVSAWLGISEGEGRKLFVQWTGGGEAPFDQLPPPFHMASPIPSGMSAHLWAPQVQGSVIASVSSLTF